MAEAVQSTLEQERKSILARERKIMEAMDNVYKDPDVLPYMDQFSKQVTKVGMLLPGIVVLIMFYEVVMRYFFLKPTLWVNEMSLWLGGFIYLLAGVHTMQQRAHIRVTVLYDIVSPRVQKIFDALSLLCIVGFTFGLIIGSYKSVYATVARWETFGTAWDPPIPSTVKPLVLIATLLVCLQAISNFLHDDNAYGKRTLKPSQPDID